MSHPVEDGPPSEGRRDSDDLSSLRSDDRSSLASHDSPAGKTMSTTLRSVSTSQEKGAGSAPRVGTGVFLWVGFHHKLTDSNSTILGKGIS